MQINVYEYYISQILKSANKGNRRIVKFIKLVEEHIGGLRYTATKMSGTSVGTWCNREANRLDLLLKNSLGKTV